VVLQALRPSSDGHPDDFLLRLQEIEGKPVELSLKLPFTIRSIAETTLTEDKILRQGVEPNAMHLSPYQTLTLRLSVVRPGVAASGGKN
jgi:alpha-mannosidase